MTTRFFRRTILVLLVGVLLLLGFLSFQAWNQRPGHEAPLALDGAGQRELGGGQEESEAPADSKPAGGARSRGKPSTGKEKGEDKSASEPAEGKEKGDDKSSSEEAGGAKTYEVDTTASRVYVRVSSATSLGHPHGVEGKLKSGKITPGAGGELVFDMNSFKADTQQACKKVRLEGKHVSENEAQKVNQTMLSADVLDVEKYPTATCKIIIMKPADRQEGGDPGTYLVKGRLTLHGAEQPLHVKARLERAGKQAALKLSGVFAIKQTAFGMTPYSAAGGLARVADELKILAELLLGPEK
jgi:polyisoprenoid-binding protein YceI